jgi:hypothetical protein
MTLLKAKLATLLSTQKQRKQLIQMGMLATWALVQYALGNKLYVLFMIVFFFILSRFRSPFFLLVAMSVLVIVLFTTSIPDTKNDLIRQDMDIIQDSKRFLFNIFTPNSGQEVLPAEVQQMLSLLRSNHVTSYRLSKQLTQDSLIRERIKESAWPIKREASPYLLSLPKEIKNNPTCVVLDRTKDVVLAYCR